MKKYLNPKLEVLELNDADVLTLSFGEEIDPPTIVHPEETPGVPMFPSLG